MPLSISDQTDAPEKPQRTITRRRGACKGCKLKKIRCGYFEYLAVIVSRVADLGKRQWRHTLLNMQCTTQPIVTAFSSQLTSIQSGAAWSAIMNLDAAKLPPGVRLIYPRWTDHTRRQVRCKARAWDILAGQRLP
jgi:hypothetical protein